VSVRVRWDRDAEGLCLDLDLEVELDLGLSLRVVLRFRLSPVPAPEDSNSSRLLFASCDLVPSTRLSALGRPDTPVPPLPRCDFGVTGGRVGAAIGGSRGLCIVRACLAGGGASIDEYRLCCGFLFVVVLLVLVG
jgi:hypothetical protein